MRGGKKCTVVEEGGRRGVREMREGRKGWGMMEEVMCQKAYSRVQWMGWYKRW